jgi:hypothetical protein
MPPSALADKQLARSQHLNDRNWMILFAWQTPVKLPARLIGDGLHHSLPRPLLISNETRSQPGGVAQRMAG